MKDKIGIKEYTILGSVFKAKPLKLQVNKDSYYLLRKLNQHIKDEAELTDEEIRDPDYSFAVSLAVSGFLSEKENCSDVLTLLIDSETDWNKFIDEHEDMFEEIKTASFHILNDFFLKVLKLISGSRH